MSDSTTLTVRLDKSVKDRLEAVADRLNRSKSFLAGVAIEEYLAVQEWQIQGIEKALQSLGNGKGIAHASVRDWVASWDDENEVPKPSS